MEDRHLVVFAKDGNGKNIKLDNLQLANIHRKQQRIFERDRWHVEKETSYDEYIAGKSKSKNPCAKQISQYNSEGKRSCVFPSISVASKIIGTKESNILGALKKRTLKGGGFGWAYGKKKSIELAGIRKANLERRKILVGRQVTQYNLKGEKIAGYITIRDASNATKVNASDIHAVLNNRQRSAGGYLWREGLGKNKIDTKGLLTGEAWRAFRRQKKVNKYNTKGKIIDSFPSVSEAAKKTGVYSSRMSVAISKSMKLKGSYWKFVK